MAYPVFHLNFTGYVDCMFSYLPSPLSGSIRPQWCCLLVKTLYIYMDPRSFFSQYLQCWLHWCSDWGNSYFDSSPDHCYVCVSDCCYLPGTKTQKGGSNVSHDYYNYMYMEDCQHNCLLMVSFLQVSSPQWNSKFNVPKFSPNLRYYFCYLWGDSHPHRGKRQRKLWLHAEWSIRNHRLFRE